MYIINFLKVATKKGNRKCLIYIAIDIAITAIAFDLVAIVAGKNGYFAGVVCSLISILIFLSPIGEIIYAKLNGVHVLNVLNCSDYKRINYIFNNAYTKVKSKYPNLSNNIKLYIIESETPDADFYGKHILSVCSGLLNCSDEQIESMLAFVLIMSVNNSTYGKLASFGSIFIVWGVAYIIIKLLVLRSNFFANFGGIIGALGKMEAKLVEIDNYVIEKILTKWITWGYELSNNLINDETFKIVEKLGYADTFCGFTEQFFSELNGEVAE